MLYQLGALTFEVQPFNTHAVDRDSGYDFAAKDIVGAAKPREKVGEADEKLRFECKLYPHRFGGLDELDALDGMRKSGDPQILVRGDGRNMGWFLVEQVHEKAGFLNARGVGREIVVTIELVRSTGGASPESMLSTVMTLLG